MFINECNCFFLSKENSFPSQMASSSDSVTYRRALTFRGSCYSSTANATEIRVTKTLFLISIIFVVLNLPAHAVRCAQFIQVRSNVKYMKGEMYLAIISFQFIAQTCSCSRVYAGESIVLIVLVFITMFFPEGTIYYA